MSIRTACGNADELIAAATRGEQAILFSFSYSPSTEDMALFAKAVADSGKLERLSLYRCLLTDADVLLLVQAAARSRTLRALVIRHSENSVDVPQLARAVARSVSLAVLTIYRPDGTVVGSKQIQRALAAARAARATVWLLAGAPVSETAPVVALRRFLGRDGDHACWCRVVSFLTG